MLSDYQKCIRVLTRFFGLMPIGSIHIGHIQTYVRSRQLRAGASRINKEIVTLGQILEVAKLWKPIKTYYKPMPVPESIGIALETHEERYLFELLENDKWGRWKVAYCAALISNGTTAGPGEIRHLQLRDIDLRASARDSAVHIRRAVKNRFRVRTVPLNEDAFWAFHELLSRYRAMCAKYRIPESPEHYLLYHRAHERGSIPDPTEPQGHWYTAWNSLRRALAEKYPHLAKIRPYDLRHNSCTKMLENGTPERVVEEMMGHKINSTIKDRYSHIRMAAKRLAANSLQGNHTPVAAPEPEPSVPERVKPELVRYEVRQSHASGMQMMNGGKLVAIPVRRPWR